MWEQIQRLVTSLSRRQQILIVLTAVGVAAGIYFFLQRHKEKDFRPLFTGLAAEDANHVVGKLKEGNVEYRLAENGSVVLVPSARVAETRLLIAGAGLPKTGRIGFELFDKTNFGATDFAEQVNYRRALEGELERSVMSVQEVEQARVHLTFAKNSVFTEQREPAKASVLLKLRGEAKLSKKNVTAIEHLVASAVEGLAPAAVTVVDMQGNLLNPPPNPHAEEEQRRMTALDYREKVERDILTKVNATLTPVLGPDHFRASVAADVDFSAGEQSEETWDPNRSVMVTQQRTEETGGFSTPSGVPGTPSSLPRPTSRPGSKEQLVSRRTENITYQTSRLIRRVTLPEGNIKRLTVSAVVDQTVRWEGTGAKAKRILEEPNEETLKRVRDLIAGAVGFHAERGDQIFVQSLPFEGTLRKAVPPPDPPAPVKPGAPTAKQPEKPSPANPIEKWLADKGIKVNPMILIGAGAALLVLLLGGAAFVVARKRKKKKPSLALQKELADPRAEASAALQHAEQHRPPEGEHTALEASADSHHDVADINARREREEKEVLSSLQLPEFTTKKAQVLMKHISDQAKRDPVGTANVIRSWLNEKES